MANYQVHVTTSGLVGVAVSTAAWQLGITDSWAALALTALAAYLGGMIPDLDHDQALPLAQLSAWICTLLPPLTLTSLMPDALPGLPFSLWLLIPIHYALHALLRRLPFLQERVGAPATARSLLGGALLAAALLLLVPTLPVPFLYAWLFLVGLLLIAQSLITLFRQFTVHRGVFHSVPAILIYALAVGLLVHNHGTTERLLISAGALAGALSHLILDELWSVNWMGARLKKSAGTAFSFWKTKFPLESMIAWTLSLALAILLAADLTQNLTYFLPPTLRPKPLLNPDQSRTIIKVKPTDSSPTTTNPKPSP